jgi:hypothetical protein
MQKKSEKKKEKENLKKLNTKISGVLKTMGTKMPAMKKRRRDSPYVSKYFKFQQ